MTERIHVRKKGFTLVEVIVVLVVLAILAAILIPSLVKWIDEANIKRCMSEQGQVIRDYHACAANTGYGKLEPVVPTTLLNEAVQDVTNKTRTASGGGYTCSGGGSCAVSFSADGTTITDIKCSLHGSLMHGATSLDGTMTAIQQAIANNPTIKELTTKYGGDQAYNSEAAYLNASANRPYAKRLNDALNSAGIDTAAVSYRIDVKGGTKIDNLTAAGQYVVYWSDTKITSANDGQRVAVTQYDMYTKTYVAGTMLVSGHEDGNLDYVQFKKGSFQPTP